MAVDIKLKRSHTHSNIPTTSDLAEGEFAVNTYDRKLFMRDGSNNIVTVANHYATDYDSSTKTFYVTVATSTTAHPYHGTGSSNKYKINGIFSPYLKLIPKNTYRFDQSDSSNSGHPLLFYLDAGKTQSYSTGVTTNGTPGSAGAYTEIVVSDSTPPVLHYQCSAHGYMGWAATTSTRNLTGFDTDDLSEGSTNLYYTDARAQAVSINNVVEDTTPQLGGTLDTNGNNITFSDNVQTVFGTGSDLRIFHNNGNSVIREDNSQPLYIQTDNTVHGVIITKDNAAETMAKFRADGPVELYHNNIKKFETISTGIQVESTDTSSTAGPDLILYRNSSSPADADYIGQLQFKGRHDGGGDEIYAKVTGKISDSTQGTEDGLIETAIKGNGSFTIVSRQKSNELQLLNGVGLDVDGTLVASGLTYPTSDGSANQVLQTNGSGTLSFGAVSSDLVNDTTPQLGGDLDVNGNAIISASNGNITITPNGSGSVIIDGLSHPQADGNAGQVLKTDGNGQLAFASVGSLAGAGIQNVSDDSSPQLGGNLDVVTHSIVSTSNRDINITPNGTGKVVVGTNGIEFGDGTIQTSAGASQGFAIAMGVALG